MVFVWLGWAYTTRLAAVYPTCRWRGRHSLTRVPTITIIDAVTATGCYLDPTIIFKGESTQYQWFKRDVIKLVPNWLFTHSPYGWTSNEIGAAWIHDGLVPQTNKLRLDEDGEVDYSKPVLLILDLGHGVQMTVCGEYLLDPVG